MESSAAGKCDQKVVDREECGINLIVYTGMGNVNLRGVSVHLAQSEKPSLLRAGEVELLRVKAGKGLVDITASFKIV